MLFESYGNSALSKTTVSDWLRRFKVNSFNLSDKKRENRPRKINDDELQALLDEFDTQSQEMLARRLDVIQPAISIHVRAMGKF